MAAGGGRVVFVTGNDHKLAEVARILAARGAAADLTRRALDRGCAVFGCGPKSR